MSERETDDRRDDHPDESHDESPSPDGPEARAEPPARRRTLTRGAIALVVAVAVASLAGAGLGSSLRLDLPDVRALEDYTPPLETLVLAADGERVASFAEQRRLWIDLRDVPEPFLNALVATEDAAFFRHTGVDIQGIFRAAWSDIRLMTLEQGASTLTMQLARTLFLHRRKTIERKLQEMVLALEIERNYSKDEILEFYINQIYTGHGRYGIEAASRHYFGKSARDLELHEAALLAGIIQRPESISPFRNPDRAARRRSHVLNRMVVEGYITEEDAEFARAADIPLEPLASRPDVAPFFVEDVRRWLKAELGDASVYQRGLEVRTTLRPDLQTIANRAVDHGLRQLDKRQGWRGAPRDTGDEAPETWSAASWEDARFTEDAVVEAVVVAESEGEVELRFGPYRSILDADDIAWTRYDDPASLVDVGDVVWVRIEALEGDATPDVSLEQEPLVEGALVALDPRTGEVLAMTGGFDFERSEFNRAVQAKRQTGSAFKPFVYAAALARGWTLADTLMDEPIVLVDPRSPQPYQPENYSNRYYGRLTLRRALEKSANIATVRLLHEVGYRPVIETARRLGISTNLQPFPSLALGAFEISLLELTSAYATFANAGVWVEPQLVREVRDHDGEIIRSIEPDVRDAVEPRVAYLMNRCLEGVITDGTGKAARDLPGPLAGKTGTTDDNTDAWFVGYGPDLAVGVWVGFDEKKSLGSRETGALAALPIWKFFMEGATREVEPRGGSEEFERPGGLRVVAIDRETGLKANPSASCSRVISEVFVAGTEPVEYCSSAAHFRQELPYPLQRYELDPEGRLIVSESELDRLLSSDLTMRLAPKGRALLVRDGQTTRVAPIHRVPSDGTESLPPRIRRDYDPSDWVGKDGRRARVILLPAG